MEKIFSKCGMRCDLCLIYRPKVEQKDRREEICSVWGKVWQGFNPDPNTIICDGCCCEKEAAALFNPTCEVRNCVIGKGLIHCGYCDEYLCDKFPAEPTQEELVQKIEVEKQWTWEEERLMEAYACKKNMDEFRLEQEIIKHINDGAKHYIRMFASAEHMETYETEYYSYIKPKTGEHGIRFVFDIKIERLPREKQQELVDEIKALRMPIWLDLNASDEVFRLFFGKEKVHGQRLFAEDDEIYMAVLVREWQEMTKVDKTGGRQEGKSDAKVVKVTSAEEFAVWTKINNDVLAGGFADMHPEYHYPLCEKGLLDCYIAYDGDMPVAVACIMNNEGVASLEFVATVSEARRKGFARAACEQAVSDAFTAGAKLVTVRAANLVAGRLYERVGFKAYNYVL